MGDSIKTFLRSGSLRKLNKSARSVQSLPYTTAAPGAPPRQGLAPLKGDISPATHGIWTSSNETHDHLDSPAEQHQRSSQGDSTQSNNYFSIKATTARASSPTAKGHGDEKSSEVDAEESFDSNEEAEWDHTIGIAITTDHVRYLEHAERVGDEHCRSHAVWDHELPPKGPIGEHAARSTLAERRADHADFFFDLQAALDKASEFREAQPKSRQASHGSAGNGYVPSAHRGHTLTVVMEV